MFNSLCLSDLTIFLGRTYWQSYGIGNTGKVEESGL